MATIGEQLSSPETGWIRYDDISSEILVYGGDWDIIKTTPTGWTAYNNTATVFKNMVNDGSNYITFKFVGTSLRLITYKNSDHSTNVEVDIDGVKESYNEYNASLVTKILVYEKTSLNNTLHTVTIKSIAAGRFSLDAIDINEDGYLAHPVLNRATSVEEMQIGDCIPCRYTASSGVAGIFSELGTCKAETIPTTGSATPNGLFYFIKVDKGLLIADRVVQHSISWNTLNSAGFIEGQSSSINIPPWLISYQKTALGAPITGHYEYTARTTSSAHQGANLTIKKDEYLITLQDEVIIEYDAFLTGFYYSAANHCLHIIPYDSPLSRESYYGVINGKALFIECKASQPSQNVWHHIKHIINFTTKTIQSFVGGSSYTFSSQGFETYTLGSIGMLCIGVGPYNYAAQNRYKNITIKNANSEPVLVKFTDQIYLISSLSGGCAYANVNGNATTTDQGRGGWPTNNEWDTYIVNSDLNGKITPGDNNVWNWSSLYSWVKETPITLIGSNANRVYRGKDSSNKLSQIASSTVNTTIGFRPVLEYIEPDGSSQQTTLWY